MANIRTLSDYAAAPSGPGVRSGGGAAEAPRGSLLPLFFSSSAAGAGGAGGVTEAAGGGGGGRFGWLQWLFPGIGWGSAVVMISLLQLAVYVASLCLGLSPGDVLAPTPEALALFGANIPALIRRGEVWRLICPIFLHLNLFHLLMNLWVQLSVGLLLERRYGKKALVATYLGVGVAANLISAAVLFCGQMKAGASTAVFGMIGVQLAELALVWNSLADRKSAILSVGFCLFFIILSSFGRHIDAVGHIAGLLLGFGAGLFLNRHSDQKPAWFDTGLAITKILFGAATVASVILIWGVPRCQ